MSRPVATGGHPHHCVESFEAQRVELGQGTDASRNEGAYVRLPTCSEKGAFSGKRAGGKATAEGGSEGEEKPQDRLAKLEKEAYERGFEQGRRDGLALEKRQMDEKGKQLEALLSSIHELKAQIHSEAEKDLLRLSTLIARRIIRGEVKTEPRIICNAIQAALEFVVDKNRMKILIHPEDMEEVRGLLPSLSRMTKGGQFEVVEDHAIERGGCILETGFGRVNATIEDQLETLQKVIDQAFEPHGRAMP